MEEYPKFWKKAIKGSVGGRVLNKKGDPEEFLLKGDPNNPEADITVEVRDEEAEKYFKRSNRAAISQGYLIEISENVLSLDETNAVSDGYLRDLLKKPLSKMRVRVDKFTSPIPVIRLLEFAEEDNKPVRTIDYLKNIITKLEGSPSTPNKAEIGGVQLKTV
jgi:hypothetical protein